ncbi:AraC family transcriptional regulator [Paenibacillus sacheonensis]|uniref:Helix-turn-helix domain-containing protein n=1 Tax=Paenibacillus sacheonensis TaxID=742054 RepID=A0A7X4YPW3_9BACL|nr:AraC family transcriptional regulator [Paenibacillus sacheonensis]MBM7566127.1 AraC-like DNA-binding protein [Paenibacillus sacheonensis]NBC70340.1 helix-turn-helix domain-containing protein [Paenibacillus sacheonensis]
MERLFNQLSPYVRIAIDSMLWSSWRVEEREIWDYEILYLKEGRLEVSVEDKIYAGIAGDIFIFKPAQRHSIRALDGLPVRQPHIHFDLIEIADSKDVPVSFRMSRDMQPHEIRWFRPDLLSANPMYLPNHIRLRHPERFELMLFELIEEFQTKPPMYEISCKGLLLSLLIYLIRQHGWHTEEAGADMQSIRRYLHQNSEREVHLEELSAQFKLSKYYLVRAYKQRFHISPIEHHRQIRLDKAKLLLRYSNAPIQQIADQLRFGSIHAFSRAFKSAEGASPSEYRRMLQVP